MNKSFHKVLFYEIFVFKFSEISFSWQTPTTVDYVCWLVLERVPISPRLCGYPKPGFRELVPPLKCWLSKRILIYALVLPFRNCVFSNCKFSAVWIFWIISISVVGSNPVRFSFLEVRGSLFRDKSEIRGSVLSFDYRTIINNYLLKLCIADILL